MTTPQDMQLLWWSWGKSYNCLWLICGPACKLSVTGRPSYSVTGCISLQQAIDLCISSCNLPSTRHIPNSGMQYTALVTLNTVGSGTARMHAFCVLHVVLNPTSRVSAVDRSKQQVCNAHKASDHAALVILCHHWSAWTWGIEALSCVLVSSQDQQNVI